MSRNWRKLDILCENEWCEHRIATRACETDGSLVLVSTKAELLQLKPHPFICMRNFINEKVGNRKN